MGDSFTAYLNGLPFSPLNGSGKQCSCLLQARNGAQQTLSQSSAKHVDVFRNGVFKGEIKRSRTFFSREETFSYSGYL